MELASRIRVILTEGIRACDFGELGVEPLFVVTNVLRSIFAGSALSLSSRHQQSLFRYVLISTCPEPKGLGEYIKLKNSL